jgi:hypothetical protein
MNSVYKFVELQNGDILLKKTIIDNNIYIQEKQGNDYILKKKRNVKIIDISDIENYDFKKSSITRCLINNDVIDKNKYKHILEKVYSIINDGAKIIKNTKLHIKTIKKQDEGFYYLDEIGISIQGVDSNKCLSEILNQCKINEIDIKITIELMNNITLDIDI